MRRSGCTFQLLLIAFIAVVLMRAGGDGESGIGIGRDPVEVSVLPGPDGPMPRPDVPEYGIEEQGAPQDSQGTAFAIAPDGVWLTAEHVVKGCDRIGLATGAYRAESVRRVLASSVSDAALIADGLPSEAVVALAAAPPRPGEDGYHMGFPTGRPAVVHSRLIGVASAMRGRDGPSQTVLAWAEVARYPAFDHVLSGISGGPTLDRLGRVVGINSASSERRGRVLTTHPREVEALVRASGEGTGGTALANPIPDPAAAARRFEDLVRSGGIRQVFCDVVE